MYTHQSRYIYVVPVDIMCVYTHQSRYIFLTSRVTRDFDESLIERYLHLDLDK